MSEPAFTPDEILAMTGATAFDPAGAKVGAVGDVYLDDATGAPVWVTVTTGLFGMKVHFAPLAGASVDGHRLVLAYGRETVLAAPRLVEDDHLTAEEEALLFAHYGLERPVAEGADVAPEAGEADVATASAAEPAETGAAPASEVDDLEAPLLRAERATEEALEAAQKADPLGDGSYAGDASKAWLPDTSDLDALDHADEMQPSAERSLPAAPQHAASESVQTPRASPAPQDLDGALPDGTTPADVLVAERHAEEESEARRAAWETSRG